MIAWWHINILIFFVSWHFFFLGGGRLAATHGPCASDRGVTSVLRLSCVFHTRVVWPPLFLKYSGYIYLVTNVNFLDVLLMKVKYLNVFIFFLKTVYRQLKGVVLGSLNISVYFIFKNLSANFKLSSFNSYWV